MFKHPTLHIRAAALLTLSALSILTGCVDYAGGPGYSATVSSGPLVVSQDEYDYYPAHNIYYNRSRRHYVYQENGSWNTHPRPRGLSLNTLHQSPYVRADFHDAPARHHQSMTQRYPRNWKPQSGNQNSQHPGNDQHNNNNNGNHSPRRR